MSIFSKLRRATLGPTEKERIIDERWSERIWISSKKTYGRENVSYDPNRTRSINSSSPSSRWGEYLSSLWHITHINNVQSICESGIFNHYDSRRINPALNDISDPDVQQLREDIIEPIFNRGLREYVPLYINPRNPMLYAKRHLRNNLCVIELSLSFLDYTESLFTDGNAASRGTLFYGDERGFKHLPWDVLNNGYWDDFEDGKRKMCAEVLAYPSITPEEINAIYVSSEQGLDYVSNQIKNLNNILDIYQSPKLFF